MANYLFLLAAVCLCVLLPTVSAQNGTHHEYCFVCETIVNVAKHEKPKDINALQKLVDKECIKIASFFHDTKKCLEIFNNGTNLQTVWTLLQNDTHARTICVAINQCKNNTRSQESTKVAEPVVAAGNGTHEYCFVCETIVNVAKHEKPKDINALQKLIDKECKNIASFFHDTKKCLEIFNNGTNLQTVWTLMQNDTHARTICVAINQCKANARSQRSIKVVEPVVAASHEYCFVCETIVNVAKHEKPKDMDALKKLLKKECENIASFFHDTKKCEQLFNNGTNLQTVWNLLQNNTHARAICVAIDQCDPHSNGTKVELKEQTDLCTQCKSAARDFKYLSKAGLNEELQGLCASTTDGDCAAVAFMELDSLFDLYQGAGKDSDTACHRLNLC